MSKLVLSGTSSTQPPHAQSALRTWPSPIPLQARPVLAQQPVWPMHTGTVSQTVTMVPEVASLSCPVLLLWMVALSMKPCWTRARRVAMLTRTSKNAAGGCSSWLSFLCMCCYACTLPLVLELRLQHVGCHGKCTSDLGLELCQCHDMHGCCSGSSTFVVSAL